jgi:hypothetical protein
VCREQGKAFTNKSCGITRLEAARGFDDPALHLGKVFSIHGQSRYRALVDAGPASPTMREAGCMASTWSITALLSIPYPKLILQRIKKWRLTGDDDGTSVGLEISTS